MTALLLAAVGGSRRKGGVTLSANLLLAAIGHGKDLDARLHDTTPKSQDQVQGALFLDVVVGQGAAVLKLLSGEDETLLVRWDALFVLNLLLDDVDAVVAFDLQGDGLASQGFNEDLHLERDRWMEGWVSGV